jgi:hypothetical protein
VHFSQEIQSLIGGKQYRVQVDVKDQHGRESQGSLDIPYVREFENIAGSDNTTVIADYYTWYVKPPGAWVNDDLTSHSYTPILGEYDSADPTVISKHIDWATGHGIDTFSVSWWGDVNVSAENLTNAFLKHPMANQMMFFILYENNGRLRISNPNEPSSEWIEDLDDSFNRSRLISDFELLAENYFAHPNYLGINGKPVVRFDYTTCFRGDVAGAFAELREALKQKGLDVYLINDLMGRGASPYTDTDEPGINETHFREITQAFDAIGASGFSDQYDDIAKDAQFVESVYHAWRDYAKKYGKDFVPGVCPGHHGSPPWYVPPSYVPWKRSPERLAHQIRLAAHYSTIRTFSIISFNEWYLGHQIEPSEEEGFVYLDSVKGNIS